MTDVSRKPLRLLPMRKHFTHPAGMFQVVGSLACLGVYLSHMEVPRKQGLPLTAGSLGIADAVAEAIGLHSAGSSVISAVLFAIFALALLAATSRGQGDFPGKRALILVQMVIGLIHNNDLLLLLAAQLPIVLKRRTALTFLVVQSLGLVIIWNYAIFRETGFALNLFGGSLSEIDDASLAQVRRIWGLLLLFGAWQIFAFVLGYVAMAERVNRDRLAASHAELQAMQQLLAETHRSAERLRIARDLHDGLGHHLTALSLHLELAMRQLGGAADSAHPATAPMAAIKTSQSIAQNLFSEVRRAVAQERADDIIDLESCLRTLCAGMPDNMVTLEWDEGLHLADATVAQTLFRVVQEALSNSSRHGQASRIRVALRRQGSGVLAEIRDNGCGRLPLDEGNGLQGIRERTGALGGTLALAENADGGLSLTVFLPFEERDRP